jgi:YidC/Oxa1 family membrane protein insertase
MQRNILLFIVCSALILASWFYFVSNQNVPTDKGDATKKLAKKQDEKDKKKPIIEKKPDEKKPDEKKPDEKKPDEQPGQKKPSVPKQPAPVEPAKVAKLGGAGFHLSVDLTTYGAGVRMVVLNHFKTADSDGRPTDRPFELIQDDPYSPSFRMYHYLQSKDDNPVNVLGERIWALEKHHVEMDKDGKDTFHEAHFSTTVPDQELKIVKVYRLAPKDYHLTLLLEMHDLRTDKNAAPVPFRYQLAGGQGLPIEGEWYASIFRNALIGMVDSRGSLYRAVDDSSRISPKRGGSAFPDNKYDRGDSYLQYAGVANQFFGVMTVVDNEQPSKDVGGVDFKNILAWARPTHETSELKGMILRLDDQNDTIIFRDTKKRDLIYHLLPRTKRQIEELRLEENHKAVLGFYETPDGKRIASWIRLGETLKPQFDDITVRVNSDEVRLFPGQTVKHQFLLYHGPVKAALLSQFSGEKEVPPETVNRYTDTLHLNTMTDYHSDNPIGKFSSYIGLTYVIIQFTRLMHWLLYYLHMAFGSYGVSIIVLTLIVRACMYPISRRTALFSQKMQELAPELKTIQARYPDDPQAKMQATQEFYRKHGINPLGSCWPMFLQLPIFMGLYFALQESIHFRLADFLWIQNLAAPDMLSYWTEQIPIISAPDSGSGILSFLYLGPYFNILPIIAVVMMMFQQMATMPPPTDEQQATQQKMMKFMTIFMGIMFYKVAAGLCIYFITSSLWGMAERQLLPKRKTPSPGVPAAPVPETGIKPAGQQKWAKNKQKEVAKKQEEFTTFDKLKSLWKEILKQAEKK